MGQNNHIMNKKKMEIDDLLAERAEINNQLRRIREKRESADAHTIHALEKRKREIKYRLEMLRETPERKERRMETKAKTNATILNRYLSMDPSARGMYSEVSRYRKKLREKSYTDDFLSDVDLFQELTKRMHPRSIPKLSPEFLRDFGWMDSLKK